jgi:hypothetical protein
MPSASPLMDLLKQQHFLKRLSFQISTQSLDPVYRSMYRGSTINA